MDERRVYQPPSALQVPDASISHSDSALSAPDTDSQDDVSSSDDDDFRRRRSDRKQIVEQSLPPSEARHSAGGAGRSAFPAVRRPDSPTVRDVSPPSAAFHHHHHHHLHSPHGGAAAGGGVTTEHVFKYDSGKVTPTRRDDNVFR